MTSVDALHFARRPNLQSWQVSRREPAGRYSLRDGLGEGTLRCLFRVDGHLMIDFQASLELREGSLSVASMSFALRNPARVAVNSSRPSCVAASLSSQSFPNPVVISVGRRRRVWKADSVTLFVYPENSNGLQRRLSHERCCYGKVRPLKWGAGVMMKMLPGTELDRAIQ